MATNINPHNARMLPIEVRRAEEAGGGSSGASIVVLMAIIGAEHLLRAKKQSLTIQKLTLTSYY